ncbi:helix-turn-helix domain-containing protein [Thalassotalea psychrophila]|uniref:Helix-turn-helix domain-containing protein n=1 Tax=Thalassotalea psychrophila TaxID=3065647 RepID=A0ABY9U102_9GAMM|nr:helix-turn-helix domain-containing protein [Colwelliaceae bacterium SQ149]
MSLNQLATDSISNSMSWPCDLSNDFKQQLLLGSVNKSRLKTASFHILEAESYGMFYIKKGCLMMTSTIYGEHIPLTNLYGPGDWLCYSPVMDGQSSSLIELEPLESLEYVSISKPHLKALFKDCAELYKLLFHIKSKRSDSLLLNAIFRNSLPITENILYVLSKVLYIQKHQQLHINQNQLAKLTGFTRPRINEALQKLVNDNVISISRGTVTIQDIEFLEEKVAELGEPKNN